MPKVTVHGGVSDANQPTWGQMLAAARAEAEEPASPPAIEDEGGEEPSPGSSSQTSSPKSGKTDEPSKPSGRPRARNAGNPSKKRGASSTAGSTDGRQSRSN